MRVERKGTTEGLVQHGFCVRRVGASGQTHYLQQARRRQAAIR
jgi:hypothetical protein